MIRSLAASLAVSGALFALSGSCADAQNAAQDDLAPFPAAEPGQTRHVIRLPAAPDENALRVSIIIGQEMWVDCNRVVFSAPLEERTAEGWGFNYYVVRSPGPAASTRMACPTQEKTRQVVRSADEPLLRYNSRLPLVVFAPDDVQVRYRIWTAGAEQTPATN